MTSASLRRGFSWNLAGSTIYNLSQWLLVVLLAQLTAPHTVGRFSLMLAIAAPIYLCLGLNLRVVVATDTSSRWDMPTYLRTRTWTGIASLVVTLVAGVLFGLRGWDLMALGALGGAKSVEALGQTIYGYFQKERRLDLVGGSLLLRAAVGAGSFAAIVAATQQLVLGCLALWAGWWLVYLLWDRRHLRTFAALRVAAPSSSRSIAALVRTAAPLGVDAGLSSLTINAPRYALQATLGASGLATFAALAYTAQIIGLVTASLADGLIAQLAQAYDQQRRRRFVRLLGLLVGFSAALTVVALLGAWLVGDWVIGHLLGTHYVNSALLLLLVLTAGVTTLQRSLARGLQASHQFQHIAWIDLVCLLATVLACFIMVPGNGQLGAASALLTGMATGTVITASLVLALVRKLPRTGNPKPTTATSNL